MYAQTLDLIDSEEDDDFQEIVRCVRCDRLVRDTQARSVPRGIICNDCHADILNKNKGIIAAKTEKLREISKQIRKKPKLRAVPAPALVSLDRVIDSALANDVQALFSLPYPTLQTFHAEHLASRDPWDWLLRPTEMPSPPDSIDPYLNPSHLEHTIGCMADSLHINLITVLQDQGVRPNTLTALRALKLSPELSSYGTVVTRLIYELQALNRQLAMALIVPYVVRDYLDHQLSFSKLFRIHRLKPTVFKRVLCQDSSRPLNTKTIVSLMDIYDIDPSAISRLKLRMLDSAMLYLA